MSAQGITEDNEFKLEPLEENVLEEDNPIDVYDPHEHRSVTNPTTTWQTFAFFLKASIGIGALAMPMAFAHAGYIHGLILTIFIGTIALHCMQILIGSMYELCIRKRTPHLAYSEAMKIGFQEGPLFFQCIAPIAAPIVDAFLVLYHFGVCTIYVVFIADILKQILDKYWTELDVRVHMCFLILPVLLIFSICDFNLLIAYSILLSGLLLIGFAAIFCYIFTYLPPISERATFESIEKLPIFFGITLFALESVGVILAMEENMKTPKDYTKCFGVMNVGMSIVLILFCALGFFGYWRYGDDSKGNVTLNLPQDAIFAQHVKLLFAITFWITYPLQGYTTVDIIWHRNLVHSVVNTERHVHYEMLVRHAIVLLSFAFALLVPDLSSLVSLIGSFCLSILGLVFPALLQICVEYSTGYGPYKVFLIKNILVIVFGATIFVCGIYFSIWKIFKNKFE